MQPKKSFLFKKVATFEESTAIVKKSSQCADELDTECGAEEHPGSNQSGTQENETTCEPRPT